MPDFPFLVASCSGGWCLGYEKEDGSFEPASYAWPSEAEAQAFLNIARPDLGFIPSQLPGKEEGG
jgi:hypothetical protein